VNVLAPGLLMIKAGCARCRARFRLAGGGGAVPTASIDHATLDVVGTSSGA